MNITGIITEYNPFHNGHKFHLEESKKQTKSDGTICIMSGNFVQRGGPAIIDKWKRTEMALNNGVDLIIELPTFYAVSSAEFFAKGAVSILNSLNIVNNLFFGSEIGDAKALSEIAKVLVSEDERFQNILKENLSLGLTFAKAREKSLIEYLNSSEISLPLKIRSVKAGDKMQVKNLNGNKKISDIFIDEKVPKAKRSTYPIVVDAKNTVLWVPNLKKSQFSKDKSEKYDIIIRCKAR